MNKLLIISILIVSVIFISGCTDKIEGESIKSNPMNDAENSEIIGEESLKSNSIKDAKDSGIFSDSCIGYGESLQIYRAIYNNGDALEIKYVNSILYQLQFSTKYPPGAQLYVPDAMECSGGQWYTNGGSESICWDKKTGKVNPTSRGDIDKAEKFIEIARVEAEQAKELCFERYSEQGQWV